MAIAGSFVWLCLVAPAAVVGSPSASGAPWPSLVRIPIDGVVFLVLGWVLPPAVRRVWVVVGGIALFAITLLTVADLGFGAALGRAFEPLSDVSYAGSAAGLLVDSFGTAGAVLVVVALTLVIACLAIAQFRAVGALVAAGAAHPMVGAGIVVVLIAAWATTAAIDDQSSTQRRLAVPAATELVGEHVAQARDELKQQREFARTMSRDELASASPDDLLSGLRGKDVVVVFVESYGRTALQGAPATTVLPALRQGDLALREAGYSSRSAFLTSPTFGGLSWLAHSTLQSGVWVDTQQRYDQLMTMRRLTLSSAFGRAGWRTVDLVPSNTRDWPQGSTFYHFDTVYDARNLGYPGPKLGYARVPDQFTLDALLRDELTTSSPAPGQPVMAEVDLDSSHTPWAPLPSLLTWSQVEQPGAVAPMAANSPSRQRVWASAAGVQGAYAHSIAYSVGSLVSFAQAASSKELVLVVLGDHQPAAVVSGQHSDRDVPVSVITRDPAVLQRIDGWNWQRGLTPRPTAPVWPMDAFRDRFITAFSGPSP